MKKRKDGLIPLLLLIFVFFLHAILNLTVHNPWAMGDEVGVLATAARFSGLDWRYVLQAPSNYGSGVNYYGGGFGILLTPLFIFIKNRPYVLYQAILLVCALLQSLPVLFAYNILYKKLKINNRLFCAFVSVASSFFVASRATNAVNESMLAFCTWCVIYLLALMYEEQSKKRRIIYSILLSVILGYSYTVHSRALILIVVTVVSIVLVRIILCEKLVDLRFFVPGLAISFWLAGRFNDFIVREVFLVMEGTVHNTGASGAASVIAQVRNIFTNGREFLDVLLSNWLSMGMVSGYAISVCVILFFVRFVRLFKIRIQKKSYREEEGLAFLLGLVIWGCTLGTLLLFCFNWLESASLALMNAEATRGYCYLRYMGAYYGAFIVIFAYDIWKLDKRRNTFWISTGVSFGVYSISFLYMYCSILKRLPNPDGQLDFFHFFAPFNGGAYEEYANGEAVVVAVVISVVIGIVLLGILLLNKRMVWAIVVCVFFVYQYSYISLVFDAKSASTMYNSISSITQLMNNNLDVKAQIDTLYFPLISGHWEVPYLAQYYFPETKILKEFPDEKDSIMIVYRSLNETDLNGIDFKYALMPDGSYIYVSGEKYEKLLNSIGIFFTE